VWRLVASRLLHAAAVVVLVATITFVLLHLAPGDPFSALMENPHVTPALRQRLRAEFGLDRPVAEQYLMYVRNVARGNLGYSFSQRRSVRSALAEALPRTLLLMGVALAASFAVGVAVGIVQARRRGRAADKLLGAGSLFFYSMPDFWLALVVMLLFAYRLQLFPTSGMVDQALHLYMTPWDQFIDRVRHLVLPAGTLTLLTAAGIARFQRAAMLDAASQEFVRAARAKGVSERRVVMRHVLRNALLPVITLLGLALPALLGGAVFVERIFAWPGMGYLTTQAIEQRDYPLVTAAAMIGGVLVSAGSLLADVLYAAADPRLRTD
jgi:peptide/nickel transport system permease protein